MQVFRYPLNLFLILLLGTGCDIFSPEDDTREPGALSLVYAYTSDDTSDIFDLGDIKNTRSYEFYLTNSGETDLFDVSISSSNDQFLVEPTTIRELRFEEGEAPYRNLRIIVVHGTSASGIGPAETLAMGQNEANLDISAKTTNDDGDTLLVDLQAILRLNARLVDVEVYDSQGAIDLTAGRNATDVTWESRWYNVVDGPIRIVNTGNVQLQVQILKQFENPPPVTYEATNVALDPQEEATVDRTRERIFFRIDGDNTISDFETLPVQQDGLIYFVCSP